MRPFDILEEVSLLDTHLLVDASAGTGKTFMIEHTVVRLLLEGSDPLTIEKILLVTFTRLATRDLRKRIRSTIDGALNSFEGEPTQGYLKQYFSDGVLLEIAKRRLERALLAFDEAQIFTIHSFCSKMLRENAFEGNMKAVEESVNPLLRRQLIRDYFRSQVKGENIGQAHLSSLLKAAGTQEELETTLVSLLEPGLEIEPPSSFNQLVEQFQKEMLALKQELRVTSAGVMKDFDLLSPCYKGITKESLPIIERFASLFDQEQWTMEDFNGLVLDQLHWCEVFNQDNLKKNAKLSSALHYPNLGKILKERISPLIHPKLGLIRIAYECQLFMKNYLEKEEQYGYDDLLKKMRAALENVPFKEAVRGRYRAVIVDEFQDTDPLQWEIFKTLFPPSEKGWGRLYLVGDPKQSIYAFRQADIYTYLDAAESIGGENRVSLNINYRSSAPLVEALNALFAESSTPGWMPLPRTGSSLPVPSVKSSTKVKERIFNDDRGALHFFLAEGKSLEILEESRYFPFIVQEIQRLHFKEKIPYDQFAVLVADRYQAQRMASFLKEWQIPSIVQRSLSLGNSEALPSLRELLRGVFYSRNESALKTALGGRIMGWTHEEVRLLENLEKAERVLIQFNRLAEIWKREGSAPFFQALLLAEMDDRLPILERLLSEEGGADFLNDLQQLIELVIEFQKGKTVTVEKAIALLDEMEHSVREGEESEQRRLDHSRLAVRILTLHASKGLEFEIVFALGLVKRSKNRDLLIPFMKQGKRVLRFYPNKEAPERLLHARESDAEKMRLLYVALTRAKQRVYCPVALLSKSVERGEASSIDLFLARLGQPFIDEEGLYKRIKEEEGRRLIDFIGQCASIGITHLDQVPSLLEERNEEAALELIPPKRVIIPGSPLFLHSFTSLSAQKKGLETSLMPAPHDFFVEERSPFTLPSGSETGNLLHRLLEKVSFLETKQWRNPQDSLTYILPFLKETPFFEWSLPIATILYHAFKTPLKEGWALQDVDQKLSYQEAEFLFAGREEGLIKGFIDLFFQHAGKYYLLDWKSNWLGPTAEDYEEEKLKQAMKEHEYFFQAEIYATALKKYLALYEKQPFEEIFGGVFYVFLRGLPNYGIYHFFPEVILK